MTGDEHGSQRATQRWLARLSFTFFIAAMWLGWVGYRGMVSGEIERWQAWVCLISASMAFTLGLAGVRERHRPQ